MGYIIQSHTTTCQQGAKVIYQGKLPHFKGGIGLSREVRLALMTANLLTNHKSRIIIVLKGTSNDRRCQESILWELKYERWAPEPLVNTAGGWCLFQLTYQFER